MAETISASFDDRETSMPYLILSCASNIAAKESVALLAEEVPRDFLGGDDRGVLGLTVRSLRLLFFFSTIRPLYQEDIFAGARRALSPPFLFSSSSFFLLSSKNTSLPEGPTTTMIFSKRNKRYSKYTRCLSVDS